MFWSVERTLLLTASLSYLLSGVTAQNQACRCLPSDACWPDQSQWQALNSSVGGRLIATVPMATVCHGASYNETACQSLTSAWPYPQTHMVNPSSIVAPYFQNDSCVPYTAEQSTCQVGELVEYAINVSSATDVAYGLQFANDNNIRLVIKATGHDFLGRSTGTGGLGLWMFNLKSTEVLQYTSPAYNGSAFKMGAGVLAYEAIDAVTTHGLRVLTGNCPTLALAGGYNQGGGHSLLSSTHGLGSDNVLEWEVVTANGTLLVATPYNNADLYWALSGGGPGTYGVVISTTVKAFSDNAMGGGNGTITMSPSTPDDYWEVVSLWHASVAALTDIGGSTTYTISNTTLDIVAIALPGGSGHAITEVLQPFINNTLARHVTFDWNTTTFSSYKDFYNFYFGLPYGDYPSNQVEGSRLFPRSVVEHSNENITAVIRSVLTDSRFGCYGVAMNVSNTGLADYTTPPGPNSVLPAWREALLHLVITGEWDETAPLDINRDVQDTLTRVQIPKFEALTPNSGAYVNEGNFQQPNWKQTFWGSNYDELRRIKRVHDPDDLFYAKVGVGSDTWALQDDGALCRTGTS